MSVFDIINDYSLPNELFINFLNIYQNVGELKSIKKDLKDLLNILEEKSINEDTVSISNYLKLNVSYDRMRLMLEKNSNPKTKEEEKIIGIKNALNLMHKNSLKGIQINSVDFLDYIKISLLEKINFNSENYNFLNSNKSHRYHFNNLIDEYEKLISTKKYESTILTSILEFNIFNMNPFEKYNDLMFIYLLYYSMLRFNFDGFRYCGMMKDIINNLPSINNAIIKGSVNYDRGVFLINDLILNFQTLIKSSFERLKLINQGNYQSKRSQKGDNIEVIIINDMPSIFSKEDIIKKIPNVSNSTIMRVFEKLKNKGIIIPLGTGRSAKWQKLVDKNDKRIIFGDYIDAED